MSEDIIRKKKKRKPGVIILVVFIILAVLIAGVLLGINAGRSIKVKNLISEGEKYLSELKYDRAIASFKEAISIDSKAEKAYLGLADTYIARADAEMKEGDNEAADRDYGEAKRVLKNGKRKTKSDDIEKRLKDLEEIIPEDENPTENPAEDPTEVTTPTASTTENIRVCIKEDIYNPNYGGYYLYEYDNRGNVSKRTRYLKDDSFYDVFEYTSDSFGNNTLILHYSKEGELIKREENVYDDHGNHVSGTEISNTMHYEYDEWERKIKVTSYNKDGSLRYYTDYYYDDAGNVAGYDSYDADDNRQSYAVYQYDSENRLIRSTEDYRRDTTVVEYTYDSKGNMIKDVTYHDGVRNTTFTYEYDDAGNKVGMFIYSMRDELLYWHEYEYDSFGNLSSHREYSGDGKFVQGQDYEYAEITIEK